MRDERADIRIDQVTSNLHVTDARAMLTPEVLQQIVERVMVMFRMEQEDEKNRNRDTAIQRRALELD